MNLWLSVVVRPQATIRQIVSTNPGAHVIRLAMWGGIASVCNAAPAFVGIIRAQRFLGGEGIPPPVSLLLSMGLGAVCGVVGVYVGAIVLAWVGRRFGGRATVVELRAALAWSLVPWICSVVWIPLVLMINPQFFGAPLERTVPFTWFIYLSIVGTASLWDGINLWRMVVEVQGFSIWKGFAALQLTGLIMSAPVVLVMAGVQLPSVVRKQKWWDLRAEEAKLYRQGKEAEALALKEEMVEYAVRAFGESDLLTAMSYSELAFAYNARGQLDKAETTYRQAIAAYEKAMGPNYPNLPNPLYSLAAIYSAQGRDEEAAALIERARQIENTFAQTGW